jgi:hypothetical protein
MPSVRPSESPSQAPSTAPIAATVPTDASDKKAKKGMCFSAFNSVHVKKKGFIPMHALEVGDWVRTNHNNEDSFSRILSFMHIDRDAEVNYLQFFMENKEFPLEVSQNHLLIKDPTGLTMNAVRAQDIQVGDILSGSKVARISTVQRRGLYAPVTETGTIWVSGVTASCYVDFLSSMIVPPTLQAHASHAALTPLRVLCGWKFSLCKNETYSADGFSSNVWMMARFGLHLSTWNDVFQLLVLVLCTPVLVGLTVLETFVATKYLSLVAVGLVAGGFCFYARKVERETHWKQSFAK